MGLGYTPRCLATSHILRWSSGRAKQKDWFAVFNTRENGRNGNANSVSGDIFKGHGYYLLVF